MSKMVPITSPDLILSSCMEPGHREPLDQLFKRWLDLLFDPLLLRGSVGKSDEVKTTDSVIIHLIWPIEELDIRSMSL